MMTYWFRRVKASVEVMLRTVLGVHARLGWVVSVALLGVLLGVLASCAPGDRKPVASGSTDDLLLGLSPSRVSGARRVSCLTDGVVGVRGDLWKSNLTSVFSSSSAFVEYDLGVSKPIRAAYVQGDNNDTYIITVSEEGETYRTLWTAGPSTQPGLQPRSNDSLDGRGRYVRISATGGDGMYALSEVQVFSQRPSVFPPELPAKEAAPLDETVRTRILLFGLALSALLMGTWQAARWRWKILFAVIVVIAGWGLGSALAAGWPPGTREVSLMRGVVAGVACLAVVRTAFASTRWRADRHVVLGTLGVCAILAFGSFYNLGHPQFHDHKTDTPRFIHDFDMRVYYPVAKYFKELRYDGLYMASVAAYVDDDPSVSMESLGRTPFRSLRTHRMTTVSEARNDIAEVRQRFSPERWAEFKTDMRYFRERMGVHDYLGSMTDHGANATPVWMAIARVMFGWTHASEVTLTLGGLVDPALLIVMFIAIWRTFGLHTMLISVIVFGATDYYMFGSNWAGATLRHDWMAYLGLGACALARQRWRTSGAFFMLSGLIRAFPGMALIGAAIPAIGWLVDYVNVHGRLPSLKLFREQQRAVLQVALGALVCGLGFFVLSVALCSFHAWPAWMHKITLLQRDAFVNQVGWRGLLGGPEAMHDRILASRASLFWSGVLVFGIVVFLLGRVRRPHQAAVLSLMMVPVALHSANYYAHFIFLLPLLASEFGKAEQSRAGWPIHPVDGGVWVAVLLLCAAQYGTVLVTDLGLHFYLASALLMVCFAVILLLMLASDLRAAEQVPAEGPSMSSQADDEPSIATKP